MTDTADLISVCVCTFRRPKYLDRLLNKLSHQMTEGQFGFSVVVVDNDDELSGRSVVETHKGKTDLQIEYVQEKRRSISHARNTAIKNAEGNFIAFIDDDEFPDDGWLVRLYDALKKYNADGVLGPVKPHFEIEPPKWIIKSRICERESFQTGYRITDSKYTRTGNALLKREILADQDDPFDPKFGIIGGGDADYFRRRIETGCTFVWCNEACVYETIPPFRFRRSYYIQRAFTRGATCTYTGEVFSTDTLKSIFAVCIYAPALPFLFIFGHHFFMRYLIKTCDHLGKLLAYMGIQVVKQRPY